MKRLAPIKSLARNALERDCRPMLFALSQLVLPFLHAIGPERAHELTLLALEAGLYPRAEVPDDTRLAQSVMGLAFSNPVGLAAGFDKNARVPQALLEMGCGFAEVGTLTPKPQPGNPAPRVFRSLTDRAVINQLGFPNEGQAAALARLSRRPTGGVLGVNIGANKDSADRIGDYVAGVEAFAPVADYITVNISSPNTPGLRDLQGVKKLDSLLARVMAAQAEAASRRASPPIVVKLAPDIEASALPETVCCLEQHGVDAIMVANTTISRAGLTGRAFAQAQGGLSGRPLFAHSTAMLAKVHTLTQGRVPLIGVGGVDSGKRALEKMQAGASLIQLYSALVFEGPGLIGRIKAGLIDYVRRNELHSVAEIVGTRAREWASKYEEASS